MLMLKLAFRNILRNKRRTLLTMLSMFGGYFLLVISISMQEGSYQQVIDFFTRNNTGHVQISEPSYQERPTLYKTVPATDDFYQELITQPNVLAATPRIVSGALAYGDSKSFPVQVMGIDIEKEKEISFLADKVKQGIFFSPEPDNDGYYQTMIGASVAQQLKVGVGDEIVLISQGADGSIANDIYLVSAIVGTKDGLESRMVYLPLGAAQSFFTLPNKAHYWVVMTDDYHQATVLGDQLNQWLADNDSLEANSWQVVSKEFYDTMMADIQGGYISYYIIVFLVCIGVLNTVLMSVMERTGEFGVLKAVGTSPKRLFALIVLETLMLSGLSCIAGAIAVTPLNYYLATTGYSLPTAYDISGVIMDKMVGLWNIRVFLQPAVIVLVATAVISVFPALRAARIVPVDAIRNL
ncbi:MAG: ABC transporter permease [Reinekea sp.]|jgi:putative ABC transport system permease protein